MGVTDRLMKRPDGRRISKPVSMSAVALERGGGSGLGRLMGRNGPQPGSSAVVYRCVQAIAAPLAALDIVVLDQNTEPILNHQVSTLLNVAPNPLWSARTLKEVAYSRMEYRGQFHLYVDRGPTGVGEPRGVWPIFDQVLPVVNRKGAGEDALQGWQVKIGNDKPIGLLPSEVLWLRYPHPDDPWGCLAPWAASARAEGLDNLAAAWQEGEFKNGARTGNVVYLGDLEESVFNQTVAEWRAASEGPENALKQLFTSGSTPAKVERMTMTGVELGYLESRVRSAEEACLAFGVPKDHLMGGSTYDNQHAAWVKLWTDRLVPSSEIIVSELDRQMLPDPREQAAMDVSGVAALQENQDAIVGRVVNAVNADLMMVDEGREELGLEPLPGGIGQQTITGYREAVRVAGIVATDVLGAGSGARATLRRFTTRSGVLVRPPRPVVPAQREQEPLRVPAERVPEVRAKEPRVLTPREVQRAYDRHEAVGERNVRRLAAKMERVVVKAAEKFLERSARQGVETRITADSVYDEAYWRQQISEYLGTFLANVWDDGGASTAAGLGLSFDVYDARVTEEMQARLATLSSQVSDTTRQAIASALITDAAEEGADVDTIAARLRGVFDDLSSSRARTIARTEVVGGFNAASQHVARSSGLVTRRRWLATSDSRTRDSHKHLDGHETVGMDDAYPIRVMHPGDPSGPSEETINCRCVEEYVLADEEGSPA